MPNIFPKATGLRPVRSQMLHPRMRTSSGLIEFRPIRIILSSVEIAFALLQDLHWRSLGQSRNFTFDAVRQLSSLQAKATFENTLGSILGSFAASSPLIQRNIAKKLIDFLRDDRFTGNLKDRHRFGGLEGLIMTGYLASVGFSSLTDQFEEQLNNHGFSGILGGGNSWAPIWNSSTNSVSLLGLADLNRLLGGLGSIGGFDGGDSGLDISPAGGDGSSSNEHGKDPGHALEVVHHIWDVVEGIASLAGKELFPGSQFVGPILMAVTMPSHDAPKEILLPIEVADKIQKENEEKEKENQDKGGGGHPDKGEGETGGGENKLPADETGTNTATTTTQIRIPRTSDLIEVLSSTLSIW